MSDDPAVPEFRLPAWGTEGAPPQPPVLEGELDAEIEIRVEAPVIVVTTALPDRWTTETIHGVVTGFGVSDRGIPAALEDASADALESLEAAAAELGANAVTGVRLTTTRKKSNVAVMAYGTAVTFSR